VSITDFLPFIIAAFSATNTLVKTLRDSAFVILLSGIRSLHIRRV